MNKILLWGNNVFIPIDTFGSSIKSIEVKYKLATINGSLLNDNTYTHSEVVAHTKGTAVECNDFIDLIVKYNK